MLKAISPFKTVYRRIPTRICCRSMATAANEAQNTYVLPMFPYPSGKVHMGHVRVFSISDCISRFLEMKGHKVLHPLGWDAFGLPAENAAMERGIPPALWTEKNIREMRSQIEGLHCNFTPNTEVTTSSPEYYRWTQWLFLKLWEKGYVGQKDGLVNWDPVDKTVLANEQVDNEGKSWRSGALVEKRKLRQWYVLTTKMSEELLAGLDKLENWPSLVKTAQTRWIGKSKGAEIAFALQDQPTPLSVFTTRPETIMGVTFLGLSANHPLTLKCAEKDPNLQQFLNRIQKNPFMVGKQNVEGYKLPIQAIHPITHKLLQIFVSNYVLADYGAGAVMGVPSHDERDAAFANKYHIGFVRVVDPKTNILEKSGPFTGLPVKDAVQAILAKGKEEGWGHPVTRYRLRDWLVSRQRYWGTPVPAIHCPHCGVVPVPYEDLPVMLPAMKEGETVKLAGEDAVSPLGRYTEWKQTTCPCCGQAAERDCDTLDTFMDSSWYFYRYVDPTNTKEFASRDRLNTFPQVDYYIGGAEHSIMHLLFSRFISRFLHQEGFVPHPEPFNHLITQGMVLSETFVRKSDGKFMKAEEVHLDGSQWKTANDEKVVRKFEKMSKSKHNGVDPVEVLAKFGSDAVRIGMLMQCPPSNAFCYTPSIMVPAAEMLRKLECVCKICMEAPLVNKKAKLDVDKLNSQYSKIQHDMECFDFHTVLSSVNIMLNTLLEAPYSSKYMEYVRAILQFMKPFAPITAEACWKKLIEAKRIKSDDLFEKQCWPTEKREQQSIAIIQVNGKMKATFPVEETLTAKTDPSLVIAELEKVERVRKILTFQPRDIKVIRKGQKVVVNYIK